MAWTPLDETRTAGETGHLSDHDQLHAWANQANVSSLGVQYVDATNGSDTNSGYSWGDAVQTIKAAVDTLNAASGGHIFLSAGTHSVSSTTAPVLTKPIRITGAGRAATAVEVTTTNAIAFEIAAARCTIEAMQIRCAAANDGNTGTGGIYVRGDAENCTLRELFVNRFGKTVTGNYEPADYDAPFGIKYQGRGAQTTINDAGGINDTDTTVIVTDASGLPATPFPMWIDRDVTGTREYVNVTNIATNTLTITRNYDGRGAYSHADGATVEAHSGFTTICDWQHLEDVRVFQCYRGVVVLDGGGGGIIDGLTTTDIYRGAHLVLRRGAAFAAGNWWVRDAWFSDAAATGSLGANADSGYLLYMDSSDAGTQDSGKHIIRNCRFEGATGASGTPSNGHIYCDVQDNIFDGLIVMKSKNGTVPSMVFGSNAGSTNVVRDLLAFNVGAIATVDSNAFYPAFGVSSAHVGAPRSGVYYDGSLNGAAYTGAAWTSTLDRLYFQPFFAWTSMSINALGVNVTTAVASGGVRLGIYASTRSGNPGELLRETSALDASTTGAKEGSITSLPLGANQLYWLAVVTNSSTIALNAIADSQSPSHGANTLTATANLKRVYQAHTYAALPDPASTSLTYEAGSGPRILVKVV